MNRGKNIIISDCEWIEDSDYILLGEYVFGFSLYSIIGNRIQFIKEFSGYNFEQNIVSIQDIKVDRSNNMYVLYVLDRFSGVYKV